MKKLLMLGTSYGSVEFVQAAKARGVYTIVTDYLPPEKSRAKLVADEQWMISTDDIDALEQECRRAQVDAILCGVSQFNMDQVLKLGSRLDLPVYCDQDAWHYTKNKRAFKDVCKACGVPVATDYHLTDELKEEDLDKVVLPVMVKPVDLSGNKGVSYCYTRQELKDAYKYARSVSADPTIVVERMLKGREYVAAYALAEGEASLVEFNVIFPQPGEPNNCWTFNMTVTEELGRYRREVDEALRKAIKKMGCKDGVAWFQMILDEDGHFYVFEMGYRLQGCMIWIPIEQVRGFDCINWVLDTALGIWHTPEDLPKPLTKQSRKCGVAYVLWSNKEGTISEIRGLEKLSGMPELSVDFQRAVGFKTKKYSNLGVICFSADNIDEFCNLVSTINDTLKVKNEHGENMLIFYDDLDTVRRTYKRAMLQDGLETN